MKIVMVTAEVAPLASTGCLGDSVFQLSRALARAGHQLTIILPAYQTEDGNTHPELWEKATVEGTLEIPVGARRMTGRVLRTQLPGAPVEVLLLDQPEYFHRPGLYHPAGPDYRDQCERFVFLCRGALQCLVDFEIDPDIIHAHDWPTGLLPAIHKIELRRRPGYDQLATVFTVHNMAYQGEFWHWDMELTGLDWRYFNWRQMECFGKLNLLKTGLAFSDQLTTTSPTYAHEIQEPTASHGLHGLVRLRNEDLTGILPGLDSAVWNPATDHELTTPYDYRGFAVGKAANKAALQTRVGLPIDARRPLAVFAHPLTPEQGSELLLASLEHWPWDDLQLLLLLEAKHPLPERLLQLQGQHPERLSILQQSPATDAQFRQALAGADLSLHLSAVEPCAQRQMISLAYGAVPVTHMTGALADTIVDTTPATLQLGTATGFAFSECTPAAFLSTLQHALASYQKSSQWAQITQAGMHHDWSWTTTADQYLEVYRKAALRESRPQPAAVL